MFMALAQAQAQDQAQYGVRLRFASPVTACRVLYCTGVLESEAHRFA
jgi:hypothetical protein